MPTQPLHDIRYILDGHKPVLCPDFFAWAKWFGDTPNRRVALTMIGEWQVSTVFLGIDHDWSGLGPPILFETMGWNPDGNGIDMERYCTWEEAEAGHARWVAATFARHCGGLLKEHSEVLYNCLDAHHAED